MSIQTASAYGWLSQVPRVPLNSTIDLNGVYCSPAGGRIFHVRGDGTSILAYDDQYGQNTADMNQRLWPSVASVLPYCVASRKDRIIVHPNHTENIASADAWAVVAGLSIVGLGFGATRPTFTFSAADSTLVLDAAGISVQNCRWLCAGPAGTTALTVTAPLSVTGEGCTFEGNYFEVGIDADQLCTAFCNVAAANVGFYANTIRGLAQASTPTSIITLTGADYFKFVGNHCKAALSAAAKGFIANSTTASADVLIQENNFWQWKSDSSACISLAANSVTTGMIVNNRFRVMGDSIQPVVYSGTGVDVALFGNYCDDTANGNGALVVGAGTST